jgi:5'-nucleotidase (lipoprotein e(P4) family)
VITDADETLIDNSTYQMERAALDSGFSNESWNAWGRRRAAAALPGAVEFTRHVRVLGGRVAVVTNRDESVCDDTRANLTAVGITYDLVLCQPAGASSDKNPRFAAVAQGGAAPGVPALRVLMWLGDNIRDFPALGQAARDSADALAPFGRTYFLLPNPMYGSWEQNEMR